MHRHIIVLSWDATNEISENARIGSRAALHGAVAAEATTTKRETKPDRSATKSSDKATLRRVVLLLHLHVHGHGHGTDKQSNTGIAPRRPRAALRRRSQLPFRYERQASGYRSRAGGGSAPCETRRRAEIVPISSPHALLHFGRLAVMSIPAEATPEAPTHREGGGIVGR